MKVIRLFTVVCLSFVCAYSAHAQKLRTCGRTSIVHEGEIVDGQFKETWKWDARTSKGLPKEFVAKLSQVDDCKPSLGGNHLLLSSSKGAVAVVQYPSGDAVFYAAVPNAHSIELLPDGIVAAASSTNPEGDRLILFDIRHPNKRIWEMPAPAAHGVTWDPQRKVLWALDDTEVIQLKVERKGDGVDVQVLKRIAWGTKGGHDLGLSHDGKTLYVTTVFKPMVFDIATEKFSDFEPLKGMRNVKSLTFFQDQFAYTHPEVKGEWWTTFVHVVKDGKDTKIQLDNETYKTRWATRW